MPYRYDGAGQPDYDGSEPDEPTPRCTIAPIVGGDCTTIVGYCIVPEEGERLPGEFATVQAAAEAAEALGYDPWMGDEEIDAEHEALEHGDWPF